MKIADFLTASRIIPSLKATDKKGVLKEMADWMAREDPALDARRLFDILLEREKISTTAIGEGVAIPHGKVSGVKQVRGLLARSSQGVDFDSLDGGLTHLFFVLVAPEDSAADHLKALARISRLLKDSDFRLRLMKEKSGAEIFAVIKEEDGKF
ncbi:MAG: PTS sugar transporter subunit IIA [Deltaproteobacteria bacterium]|nr:PTS sugar transporter subunit IIA [Deltaproteobacteria bacterium]MBI3062439.1 PTS sugar transporter subunit IIA [Deltaproteobacteria bacterium]